MPTDYNDTEIADEQTPPESALENLKNPLFVWQWEPGAPHILNAVYRSQDGSRVDDKTPVLMLTTKARHHVSQPDAQLIESALLLSNTCEAVLEHLRQQPVKDSFAINLLKTALLVANKDMYSDDWIHQEDV